MSAGRWQDDALDRIALASMVSRVPKRGAVSEAWHSGFGGAGVGGVACSAETNEQIRAAVSGTVNSVPSRPTSEREACLLRCNRFPS